MESKIVRWEKNEGIGSITLNRPEKFNAMNRETIVGLAKILEEAIADDEVKVVVITGAGKAFCTGADLTGYPELESNDPLVREYYLREVGRVPLLIQRVAKPVIAAVNGIAAGGGMDLALACDIRIASDQARFTTVFVRGGLMPDMGGTWFLPRLVGLGKAMELLFTGDDVDANEAYRIGLVNHVVPQEELMKRAMEMARRFARGPSQSYRLIKWAVYSALSLDFEAAVEHEMFGQNLLLGTEDVRNAAKAFAEKRVPVFKGK